MPESPEHDLGEALLLEAEAIGPPGQRRFRLRVTTAEATASLWCEKEQVNALATAIEQVLAQRRRAGEGALPAAALEPFPNQASHDFQIGNLALGYDEAAEMLALYATDVEAADPSRATVRVRFTREQARGFSAQATVTVEGGRPLCPLCKSPLEPEGHLCPPSNGHSEDALSWVEPLDL